MGSPSGIPPTYTTVEEAPGHPAAQLWVRFGWLALIWCKVWTVSEPVVLSPGVLLEGSGGVAHRVLSMSPDLYLGSFAYLQLFLIFKYTCMG